MCDAGPYWKDLSHDTFLTFPERGQDTIVQQYVDDHGIERPQGYNVSFHYNSLVEGHHFGEKHPMKPFRLTLTKQLVLGYGLQHVMDVSEPPASTYDEMAVFHGIEYLDFLKKITPYNMERYDDERTEFGFDTQINDCPVFDGLWDYVSLYSGSSLDAAQFLTNGQSDIAINWSGGLHHAKKKAASGFCYINDIVIAIQHLLTVYERVLYIDIDVHHGDGVEQAFYSSPRVFTLSFHKYDGEFFPATGNIDETGPIDRHNLGTGCSLNIPLEDGISDDQYKTLFTDVVNETMRVFKPHVIVLQCGADSLGGDRLGKFNINIKAHGYCVEFMKRQNLPLLLLGGGGYTPRNVARTWCHETAISLGTTLAEEIPSYTPYRKAFEGVGNGSGSLYPRLDNIQGKQHENHNSQEKLEKLTKHAMLNLRVIDNPNAPSHIIERRPKHWDMKRMLDHMQEARAGQREYREEREYTEAEMTRRQKERNTGGRLEYRFK